MIEIIKKFLNSDLDNIIWGSMAAVAILITTWFTTIDMTAMIGAFIGICLNRMRGSSTNGNGVEEPSDTI